jgi:hypothetical protein
LSILPRPSPGQIRRWRPRRVRFPSVCNPSQSGGRMALDGHQTNAVVLITAPSTEGSRGSLEPVGTGFIVAIPSERFGDDLRHFYLVTAAHVVQSRPHEACTRMRLQDGTTRDEPIPEWVFHYKYDAAAAHLDAALMFTPGDFAASNNTCRSVHERGCPRRYGFPCWATPKHACDGGSRDSDGQVRICRQPLARWTSH